MTLQYEYFLGRMYFNERDQVLQVDGCTVHCAQRQQRVLRVLLRSGGRLVKRNELIDQAWGRNAIVKPNTVDTAVSRLRQDLGSEGSRIGTNHSAGYTLDVTGLRCVAVAQAPQASLKLTAGTPVAHTAGFTICGLPLDRAPGLEVWLAVGPGGEKRRFKFATNDAQLATLSREMTLHQVLQKTLLEAQQDCILRTIEANLTQPNHFFLATEPPGQSLADWAREGARLRTMAFPDRLQLAITIVAAVDRVHGAGVVHGDLQPANILISSDGGPLRVCLANFGCGELIDRTLLERHQIDPAGLTQAPLVPPDGPTFDPQYYRAPEQRAGEAPAPTPCSDVYALGHLVYQLLAGDLAKELETGWERDIEVPLLRSDIVAATDSDPRLRIASVADFLSRLRDLDARSAEQGAREARDREASHRTARRQGWAHGSLVTGLTVCVLALIASLLAGARLWQAQQEAQQQAQIERALAARREEVLLDVLKQGQPLAIGNVIPATFRQEEQKENEQAIDLRLAADPDAHAAALLALAGDKFGRGELEEAERLQRKVIELLMRSAGPGAEQTLVARYGLLRTIDMLRRFDEAAKLLADTNRDAGPRLKQPSTFALIALTAQAGHAVVTSDARTALHLYEEAEAVRLKLTPQDHAWRYRIHSGLAWAQVRTEHSAAARKLLEDLIADPADSRDRLALYEWMKLHVQYGLVLRNLGDLRHAEQELTDVVEVNQRAGAAPLLTSMALFFLASAYEAEGSLGKAADTYRKGEAILATGPQSAASVMATAQGLEANVKLRTHTRHSRQALARLTAARNRVLELLGPDAPPTQLLTYHLAVALCERRQPRAAAVLLRDASPNPVSLAAEDASEGWSQRLEALHGRILIASGHRPEGEKRLMAAIAALRGLNVPPQLLTALERPVAQAAGDARATTLDLGMINALQPRTEHAP